ncbi:early nodulin-like protein [Striga asiatica]|uniref:Early nodulin-like protein n=1 Tax=Striga asiatica TaxID=4170 RepID=A0A5A7Q9I1_STRAF|nr:early nodulin-like protein [Striga asiatica]
MADKALRFVFLITSLFVLLFSCFPATVDGYKNYTVGDSLGWYDSLEKPTVNYQKWAAGKNFSLGDFLIFNTDNNHSVIQTYNLTTYNSCDSSDGLDNNTIEWSSADPSSTTPYPVTVPVPLVRVGPTYFFSSDYDGEQCRNGQRLEIRVARGQGLPPGLGGPTGGSPGPISPQSGDDEESAPDTLVPSNFDHPRDVSDDGDGESGSNEASDSLSLVALTRLFGVGVGLQWIFLVFVIF